MSNSNDKSLGLAELLVEPVRLQKIRINVMYLVYQGYVKSDPEEPVDTTGISRSIVQRFQGNDLVTAAYILGAIEKEVHSGENHFLLEDLRRFAALFYHKTDLNLKQFKKVCQSISAYYLITGRIH